MQLRVRVGDDCLLARLYSSVYYDNCCVAILQLLLCSQEARGDGTKMQAVKF